VLIIRRSICINTASGIVHAGRSLTDSTIPDAVLIQFDLLMMSTVLLETCKGKAVPLQAWSGPEGSRKLRFPDYVTTAQDGGKVVSLTHRPPLPPGNNPGTTFLLEAESTSGP